MVPLFIAARAPPAPSATARTSASLPTHMRTMSAPAAAAAGEPADPPPFFSTHCAAFAAVRLYTVTAWPARARCPAIGEPMTPSPRNEILLLVIVTPDLSFES